VQEGKYHAYVVGEEKLQTAKEEKRKEGTWWRLVAPLVFMT
jgi:hypothetical protein